MQRFRDEYPELAAMFQALQDGFTECRPHEKRLAKYELEDAKAIGRRLGLIAWQYDATDSAVAAGLRMVADAIDPPAMVEARRRDYRDARAIDAYAGRMGGSAYGPKHGTGQIEPTRPASGSPAHAGIKQKDPGLTRGLSRSGSAAFRLFALDNRGRIRQGVPIGRWRPRRHLGSDGVWHFVWRVER